MGSSNTLIFENGKIHAENTDYSGFISAYRRQFADRPAGRVLLIGAGGVGRAVACALGALGVTSIGLVERDAARGEALNLDLNRQGIKTETLLASEAETQMASFDGIVNCTPVGHINHPGCPILTNQLHTNQWVFDAVYIPARTDLLIAAENRARRPSQGSICLCFRVSTPSGFCRRSNHHGCHRRPGIVSARALFPATGAERQFTNFLILPD